MIMRRSAKVVVQMIRAFEVAPLGHNKNMSLRTDDLNVRPVQPGQHWSGHDFSDGAERCPAPAEVKHAIKDAQKLVEFVCAEQDGDSSLATELTDEIDHGFLVK
jgi:hypothetical protein